MAKRTVSRDEQNRACVGVELVDQTKSRNLNLDLFRVLLKGLYRPRGFLFPFLGFVFVFCQRSQRDSHTFFWFFFFFFNNSPTPPTTAKEAMPGRTYVFNDTPTCCMACQLLYSPFQCDWSLCWSPVYFLLCCIPCHSLNILCNCLCAPAFGCKRMRVCCDSDYNPKSLKTYGVTATGVIYLPPPYQIMSVVEETQYGRIESDSFPGIGKRCCCGQCVCYSTSHSDCYSNYLLKCCCGYEDFGEITFAQEKCSHCGTLGEHSCGWKKVDSSGREISRDVQERGDGVVIDKSKGIPATPQNMPKTAGLVYK